MTKYLTPPAHYTATCIRCEQACNPKTSRRGHCAPCYKRHVTPRWPRIVGDDMARFMQKVDKDGPLAKNKPELGPCWIWRGSRTSRTQHGAFRTSDDRKTTAHRWLYEQVVGAVPEELHLDHFACDNVLCVNPSHVRPVTPLENSLRADTLFTRNLAKRDCINGHPLSGANLFTRPDGGRVCRECSRESSRRYKARMRAIRHQSQARQTRG